MFGRGSKASVDTALVTRDVLREELQEELQLACNRILDGVQQQLLKLLPSGDTDNLRMAGSLSIPCTGHMNSSPLRVPSMRLFPSLMVQQDGERKSASEEADSPWSFEIRKMTSIKPKAENSAENGDSDTVVKKHSSVNKVSSLCTKLEEVDENVEQDKVNVLIEQNGMLAKEVKNIKDLKDRLSAKSFAPERKSAFAAEDTFISFAAEDTEDKNRPVPDNDSVLLKGFQSEKSAASEVSVRKSFPSERSAAPLAIEECVVESRLPSRQVSESLGAPFSRSVSKRSSTSFSTQGQDGEDSSGVASPVRSRSPSHREPIHREPIHRSRGSVISVRSNPSEAPGSPLRSRASTSDNLGAYSPAKNFIRQSTQTSLSTHLSYDSHGVGFTHHAQHWVVKEEMELVDESTELTRHSNSSFYDQSRCSRLLTCCLPGIRLQRSIKLFVKSAYLDYFSTVLILLNALQLGIQTDIAARTLNTEDHPFFKVSEYTFGFCFVVELMLKIYVHRSGFFYKVGCSWNIFDFCIVGVQVVEVIMDVITLFAIPDPNEEQVSDESDGGGSSFSVMRVLRLLRLVRVLRMVRIMHLVSELRTIIVAIFSSVRSLAWTMLLLFLIMYLMAVYILQLVTEKRKESSCSGKCDEDLGKYFGSLGTAILVLYQVITGGLNWSDVIDALADHISPLLSLLFCLYIAFVIFALMNVVTGVFVESALKSTKQDADIVLFHQLRHLLHLLDANGTGTISWEEFESGLSSPEMLRVFKSIDLGVEEAKDLFRLIDIDGSGEISFDEFTNGCLRLRGPAKAIDMAAFMFDYKRSIGGLKEHSRIVEDILSWIAQGGLHELALQMQMPLLGNVGMQEEPKLRVKMSL